MAAIATLAPTIMWSFVGGLIPALLWLTFWLQEDKIHPEPKSAITLAFVAGMASVVIALPLELLFARWFPDGIIRIISWAATEELTKYWAASYSAFRHNRNFDEPIDAMIYLLTAALGFSAAENAFFLFGTLKNFPVSVALISGSMRFVGASVLHVVASATVGAFMAFSFYKSHVVKIEHLISGLCTAIALHATFNYLIISLESQGEAPYTLAVFSMVWVGVVVLLYFFEKVKSIKSASCT